MRNRIWTIVSLLILICTVATITVFAHSGRTDSSGGHYNRSTGEYHWHHGYPAHQHEDLDGDGDLDCPYEFKNGSKQTEKKSTTKKETKVTTTAATTRKQGFFTAPSTKETTTAENSNTFAAKISSASSEFEDSIGILIGAAIITAVLGSFVYVFGRRNRKK